MVYTEFEQPALNFFESFDTYLVIEQNRMYLFRPMPKDASQYICQITNLIKSFQTLVFHA